MYTQSDFNEQSILNKKKRYRRAAVLILAVAVLAGMIKWGFFSRNIDVTNEDQTLWDKVANIVTFGRVSSQEDQEYKANYTMPKEEKDRLDILILGLRGADDPEGDQAGSMLTDTMLVFSFDKKTQRASLISIPRDLYVIIRKGKKDKINAAYEAGLLTDQGSKPVRELVSKISGVYIDNVLVINFTSFKKIIDELGGIDIELSKPFAEKQQWGYEFSLPAGKNHLDGQSALYYSRSRYSTSDFDRSNRQQQVIAAIKNKVMELNFLNDPIKTLSVLNTLRNNIDTDFNIWDVPGLLSLAKQINEAYNNTEHYVISTDNLVYETHIDGIYVLLPKGENFEGIKKLFQEVLNPSL
ncbi:MAG: hypothetical protein A3B99_00255 [Candidatus Yanofskybacteria bacterium RIFCSPHIGHO2_02_FULL_44_12b]|uniref:Cell envelope-related transcriptional attenuator domain-containing protein n=2 Tax=Candidatus Yanofskyibacteriota TaxID=1752733 RepID=A0A1F8GN94_9BACT|nr:MAG: Cell envelope-associated transcriptional attenuator [Candidatus Yanofskybacteria bacterium GW2011_GWA2_44_9]OGN04183.1 MAG: hypothetical protein A2659_01700 [Candidatus Yanofskybacteria bacterium RIFCSPHIGHO2_01_FULL_44_24]OGN14777.1 MAG: hypothetical protein A3B99_00255 [Candidatus Yanofskybacteria bacterium RIFCSPHIGHO2_02_FULL_44_12b]OGN25909.1 MAG: hypothetical protein A2925_02620 [Candidatus Yanofskybacteria bacterium RIFCSPLOWO2_01_FULL_44_22]